ncbi:hypothetical protein B0A48_02435 [Cryoendolithus antarcticus]|uniref:GTPase-activating protein GYP5 n=1 Tax=Cryoendolithus antarcticus TaxID=1507870 RepID=A0A1V8TNY9_9PEZI|nr:hypothetical protein B0A48_02435 [Cryoendolithus antarcticus]
MSVDLHDPAQPPEPVLPATTSSFNGASTASVDNLEAFPASKTLNKSVHGDTSHKANAYGLTPPPIPDSDKSGGNKAPGIPDRRKSVRPAGSRGKLKGRRSETPGITISMADEGDEARAEGDGGVVTPGETSDTFEDAVDTPKASGAKGSLDGAEAPRGLGIDGADVHRARDPSSEVNGHAHTNGVPATEPELPSEITIPKTRGPRPVSGLMSPPLHGRHRSISPGRFPVAVREPDATSSSQGLSGDLPPLKFPPPPSAPERSLNTSAPPALSGQMSPPPQPGNLARKASSGFGALLGRMGSIRKARSPPAPRQESKFGLERRNTGSSATLVPGMDGATPLSAIADGEEDESAGKPTLQDRFKTLRRQEEQSRGGVIWQHEDGDTSRKVSMADSSSSSPPAVATPGLKSPALNPDLPPGTASGVSAGPAIDTAPVNWDLWQSVVNEGPAAVARTSGAELSQAIANGIPAAIRGVVWQVLADSKSEDLESLYRTLKARGTDAEVRPAVSRTDSNISGPNGAVEDKESVASSRSSVHSESSTPATSNLNSPPASIDGTSADLKAKLLAEKQKRDSTSLAKLEKAIKRDLGSRTSYSKYAQSAGLQDGLFGVCKAYALFDEAVGYAQGINFVAMPLLFNMSEEESFTLLVRLMHRYNLRSLFEPEMPGLHLRLYQFERLLEDSEPALYVHLRRRNVGPQLYATQWFLTLFAYRFPLQLVLRIYDLVFSEGLTAILKFGLVLLQRNKETILGMKDMAALTTFLKEKLFDVYIDRSPSASSLLDSGFFGSVSGGADKELYRADDLVRDASAVQVSEEALALYTSEWEESQRTLLATASELEGLRTSNASLTSQVKALESRAQAHDSEHVGIASDLVRLKVENDTLADENEGLKLQVEQLRQVVDSQPAEVEGKLKEEMERILARNIEVQNENRGLKEEVGEMEGVLVEVKMSLAHTQSDHDALKQRWSSVQAMLNKK